MKVVDWLYAACFEQRCFASFSLMIYCACLHVCEKNSSLFHKCAVLVIGFPYGNLTNGFLKRVECRRNRRLPADNFIADIHHPHKERLSHTINICHTRLHNPPIGVHISACPVPYCTRVGSRDNQSLICISIRKRISVPRHGRRLSLWLLGALSKLKVEACCWIGV